MLILILAFTFIKLIHSEDQENCPLFFFQDFGIQAYEQPQNDKVRFCSINENTCCNIYSNIGIYQNWNINEEGRFLKLKMKYFKQLYKQMLVSLQKIDYKSQIVRLSRNENAVNNCQIMADTIEDFGFQKLINFLSGQIDKYFKYIHKSYKGFYCSICSSAGINSIDLVNKQLKITQGYCNNFIDDSVSFYAYFNYYLPLVLDLASYFNQSCDMQGNYQERQELQKRIKIKRALKKKIEQCISSYERNKKNQYCEFICQEFSIFKLKNNFLPHWKTYINFIQKINESISQEELTLFLKREINLVDKQMSQQEIYDLRINLQQYSGSSIINQQMFSWTKATHFKLYISQDQSGFDFFSQGDYLKTNEQLYNEIQNEITRLENEKSKNKNEEQSLASQTSQTISNIFSAFSFGNTLQTASK